MIKAHGHASKEILDLVPDEAIILVRGPWIGLALFSRSIDAFGTILRVGQASIDHFQLIPEESSSEAGQCRLLFKGRCPMGPALSSLAMASAAHPSIDMLLAYRDPSSGLEIHRFTGGSSASFEQGHDIGMEISAPRGGDAWAAIDAECKAFTEGLGPLDMRWLPPSSHFAQPFMGQAIMMLSGSSNVDHSTLALWPVEGGDCWSWSPSPWSPAPPWRHPTPDVWFLELAHMCSALVQSNPSSAQGVANRAVLIAQHLAASDMQWASASMLHGLPALLKTPSPWTSALSKFGRTDACQAMGLALRSEGVALSLLFTPHTLLGLAMQNPESASRLLECAPWGYQPHEIEWLCTQCPPPFSGLFERVILDGHTEHGRSGRSSSGRL